MSGSGFVPRARPAAAPAPRARADAPSRAGSGAGMPRFLGAPARVRVRPDLRAHPADRAHEREADRAADAASSGAGPVSVSRGARPSADGSPAHALARRALRAIGGGSPLPEATRRAMEGRFGADFSGVRVHADGASGAVAGALGANAVTSGRDVYFNRGRYQPGTPAGDRLLAHELAHVVQQGGDDRGRVQCDLMMSLPTALGGFEIEMATRAAPRVGMEGNIRFLPDPSGPYSAQIGLVQVVNFTDVGGSTTTPGSPMDWRRDGVGAESGRMDLMTTGAGAAPAGWMVDANTVDNARGSALGPNYIESWISPPPDNQFGFLRSPTDVQAASLYDFPSTPHPDLDFDFETVAKATDTQTVYGALHWGFGIRSGVVTTEYAHAVDTESATFTEALERFRGYFTHEPVVIYFDTDSAVPLPGEAAKFADVPGYLSRYPDVRIGIEGHADERGAPGHNVDLSLNRALSVEAMLLGMGISAARIDTPIGFGETTAFAAGAPLNAGTWRANRRVVVTFERTASTPIVP